MGEIEADLPLGSWLFVFWPCSRLCYLSYLQCHLLTSSAGCNCCCRLQTYAAKYGASLDNNKLHQPHAKIPMQSRNLHHFTIHEPAITTSQPYVRQKSVLDCFMRCHLMMLHQIVKLGSSNSPQIIMRQL